MALSRKRWKPDVLPGLRWTLSDGSSSLLVSTPPTIARPTSRWGDNTTVRGWTYETPADLAAELADEAEDRADVEWWLTTAVSLRQLFDQVETLPDEQADALWADASRHWESGPPDALADAPISAHDVCGVASLLSLL